MRFPWITVPAAVALLALAGCQPSLPTGPTISVAPGAGKSLSQFQAEDHICRSFAQNQILNFEQPKTGLSSPAGTAAATTVGGTAVGALLGAAAGNAGMGAAIGAGAGLLGGAALAARRDYQETKSLQHSYNVAYAQCMQIKGNTPPAGY